MKKVLFVLIALAILVGGIVFAAEVQIDSKGLNVYGFIPAPEAYSTLAVTQTLQSSDAINLKDNDYVKHQDPENFTATSGVKIGEWTVNNYNQLGTETYDIKYSYGKLVSSSTSQELEYVVLQQDGSATAPVVKLSGSKTAITPIAGSTAVTKTVRVMLTSAATSAVATMNPATDFLSTITLNLVSNL
jgi:hypothetical protein